jgi:hypothetical protein
MRLDFQECLTRSALPSISSDGPVIETDGSARLCLRDVRMNAFDDGQNDRKGKGLHDLLLSRHSTLPFKYRILLAANNVTRWAEKILRCLALHRGRARLRKGFAWSV